MLKTSRLDGRDEADILERLLAERRAAQGMTVGSEQDMAEPKDG
jgi:hypothetical protein